MEPDLAGFRAAQVKLIADLGTDVEFFTPTATVWPEEAVLDPETGEPYDPSVAPLSSGFSSASVRCGVITQTPRDADDALIEAIGEVEEGEAALIVPIEDFEDNSLDAATEASLFGERYRVTATDKRGLGSQIHRVLVWLRQL